MQARPFLGDVERPGLNLGNCGSRRTSGGPVGAASAQGAPTIGEALSLIERTEMSGSEFERENIVTETLSATAASKPADTSSDNSSHEHNHEHTWRPAFRPRRVSTIRATSTMPAVSASSRI